MQVVQLSCILWIPKIPVLASKQDALWNMHNMAPIYMSSDFLSDDTKHVGTSSTQPVLNDTKYNGIQIVLCKKICKSRTHLVFSYV